MCIFLIIFTHFNLIREWRLPALSLLCWKVELLTFNLKYLKQLELTRRCWTHRISVSHDSSPVIVASLWSLLLFFQSSVLPPVIFSGLLTCLVSHWLAQSRHLRSSPAWFPSTCTSSHPSLLAVFVRSVCFFPVCGVFPLITLTCVCPLHSTSPQWFSLYSKSSLLFSRSWVI